MDFPYHEKLLSLWREWVESWNKWYVLKKEIADKYMCVSFVEWEAYSTMSFNMPLKMAKDLVKELDVQYVIDEDSSNWFIQSLRSLDYINHSMPSYTIELCKKTRIDNHSMSDRIQIVRNVLLWIKNGKLDIDTVLNQIWK